LFILAKFKVKLLESLNHVEFIELFANISKPCRVYRITKANFKRLHHSHITILDIVKNNAFKCGHADIKNLEVKVADIF